MPPLFTLLLAAVLPLWWLWWWFREWCDEEEEPADDVERGGPRDCSDEGGVAGEDAAMAALPANRSCILGLTNRL